MSASRAYTRTAREASPGQARRPHRPSSADRLPGAARLTPTQSMILQLQRTVGNAAVNALLRQASGKQPIQPVSPIGAGRPVIQRLMSFNDFQKASRQIETRKKGGIRGTFGAKKTTSDGEKIELLSGQKQAYLGSVLTGHVNINEAYEKYEEDKSLSSLIALNDTITFWQTIHAGLKEADGLRYVLNGVKEQIAAEVQAETVKQSGGKATTPVDSLLKQPGKAAKAAAMEPFLKEVGVPSGYYEEQLAGKPQRIAALQDFYNNLKEGHLYDASRAYRRVSTVEGMYLIKPLFLSRFPNKAHLQGVVGTKADAVEGNEVTAEEMAAIKTYSGGTYEDINTQLRDHDMRPSNGPVIGRARMSAVDAQKANTARQLQTIRALAVSGLNKMPKFQGTAYRVSLKVPPGYFSAVRPGGMMADLAFSSASPSMRGVGHFASTQPGSKNLYYIIHTKTAVNIVALSNSPDEGEVLFRPGTRFQVEAVWEHMNGKVPVTAPAAAQMVLHTMGDVKTEKGHTKAEWESAKHVASIFTPEEAKKEYAPTFNDEKLNKVKVVEITEV